MKEILVCAGQTWETPVLQTNDKKESTIFFVIDIKRIFKTPGNLSTYAVIQLPNGAIETANLDPAVSPFSKCTLVQSAN